MGWPSDRPAFCLRRRLGPEQRNQASSAASGVEDTELGVQRGHSAALRRPELEGTAAWGSTASAHTSEADRRGQAAPRRVPGPWGAHRGLGTGALPPPLLREIALILRHWASTQKTPALGWGKISPRLSIALLPPTSLKARPARIKLFPSNLTTSQNTGQEIQKYLASDTINSVSWHPKKNYQACKEAGNHKL